MIFGRIYPFVASLLITLPSQGQEIPDVARRLEALGHWWVRTTDDESKGRASKAVDPVTFLVLTGQMGKAAQTIDKAILDLMRTRHKEMGEHWFGGLDIGLEKSLVDPNIETIKGKVFHAYPPGPGEPSSTHARFRIRWSIDGKELEPVAISFPKTSAHFELRPPETASMARIWLEPAESGAMGPWPFPPEKRILLVPGWRGIKAGLLARKAAVQAQPDSIAKLTWLHRVKDLNAFNDGISALPSGQNLATFADWVSKSPNAFHAGKWPLPVDGCDQTLVVPLASGSKTVRILLPPRDRRDQERRMVVVALHGAGDDENTWPDLYLRKLSLHCKNRGWVLVCPRGAHDPDLLPALEKWSGLKFNGSVILGHSQGGSLALSFAARHPAGLLGLASLGASGRVGEGDDYNRIPVFVGMGENDSSLGAAKSMVEAMRGQGQRSVAFRQYGKAGHILAPFASIPDVLLFLDEAFGARDRPDAHGGARRGKSMSTRHFFGPTSSTKLPSGSL